MKIQGIYKIRNCLNGKVYIGQSIDIKNRWREHRRCVKQNLNYFLYNSMRKYGLNHFEFIILEEVNNVLLLDEREQYWLDYYKSYNNEYGYNIHKLANSPKGCKRTEETKRKISKSGKGRKLKPMSEEQKRHLSEINKGKKHSEETKLKMSLSAKGRIPWNIGKKLSEETRKKISEAGKKRIYKPCSEETKLKMSEAKKGIKRPSISIEHKKIISEYKKAQWQDPIYRNKMIGRRRKKDDLLIQDDFVFNEICLN